jgi:hypothetical protein
MFTNLFGSIQIDNTKLKMHLDFMFKIKHFYPNFYQLFAGQRVNEAKFGRNLWSISSYKKDKFTNRKKDIKTKFLMKI